MPDLSFIGPLVLFSGVLPFFVALAVLALLVRRQDGSSSAVPALAIASGFLVSYGAVYLKQFSLVPHQALDWLPWITLLAFAAGVVLEKIGSRGVRFMTCLLVMVAVLTAVAWPALASGALPKIAITVLVGAVLAGLAWTGLEQAARNKNRAEIPLTIVASGAGMALMLDASMLIGQLTGGLAAALAASVAIGLWRRVPLLTPAAVAVGVVLLAVLLVTARIYAGFSLWILLLLTSGLLTQPLFSLLNRGRQDPFAAGAWKASAMICGVLTVAAVGLALKAAQDSGGY